MDVNSYFQSLSEELNALKNRVRNFIDDAHWLTDGEGKETVLRTILRRHLPASVNVGRGFVVNWHKTSTQIDILIYDVSKPVLYRDGELVFVTADAVKGIVEVKSNLNGKAVEKAASKLADNAQFILENSGAQDRENNLFVGLFAYDHNNSQSDAKKILRGLQSIAQEDKRRVVNHVCLGNTRFIQFWSFEPDNRYHTNYNWWHSYQVPRLAPGYFINNLVAYLADESIEMNKRVWFPIARKEVSKEAEIGLSVNQHKDFLRRVKAHLKSSVEQ